MRRLLLLLAICALGMPPAASARDLYFDVGSGSEGSVRDSGWSDCTTGSCAPRPTELKLERAGRIIASSGPSTDNRIEVTPRPGDIVRVFLDGSEKAAVPFDGRPTIEDSCARVGTTTVGGSWEPGDRGGGIHALLDGRAGGVSGTGSHAAGGYTVTFPRAIERDDRIQVSSTQYRSIPSGETISVYIDRTQRICPVVVPAKAVITGPAKQGKRRVRRDRRVTLPKLKIGCPGPGESCDVDVRLLSPKLGVLAVTRYKLPASGRRAVRVRLFKFAMRRLKRRKKTNVKVTINVRRTPAATVTRTVRLKLLAPRPKRG